MQKTLIVSPKTISLQGFDGAQKSIFDIAKFLPNDKYQHIIEQI